MAHRSLFVRNQQPRDLTSSHFTSHPPSFSIWLIKRDTPLAHSSTARPTSTPSTARRNHVLSSLLLDVHPHMRLPPHRPLRLCLIHVLANLIHRLAPLTTRRRQWSRRAPSFNFFRMGKSSSAFRTTSPRHLRPIFVAPPCALSEEGCSRRFGLL